ncbi:MAG: beta-propeller fold lactonase family protein [Bryobacteraceae bacterium]
MKQKLNVTLAANFLLAFVGSANAQFAYISTSGGVSVINTVTNTITATVNVGSGASGAAVNPTGTYVYVANDSSFDDTISVLKTATNTVTATVTVGADPIGVAVNPAGTFVYVTNYVGDTVSVINAATNSVTATVGVGKEPLGIAVNPAGTYVYVANEFDNTVSVINTATNTVTATVDLGGGASAPNGVAVNPMGDYLYVTNASSGNLSVINTATNTVTATVNVGNSPRGVAVNPTGTYIYVANYENTVSVISAATNAVTATVNVPSTNGLVGIAVNPTGTSVYVPLFGGNGVSIIDTSTNTITGTVKIGGTVNGFVGNFIGGPAVAASINPGGIVNGASSAANAAVAPGSLASIYGAFPVTTAQAGGAPLPTNLAGLSVQFGGIQAPLSYASGTQVNVQVPWELAGQTQASVTASVGSQTSAAQQVNIATVAPGVFVMNSQGQGAVVDALSGQLISPINPARAGITYISIYCTGLGPVTNQPSTGAAPSPGVLSETITPTVTIGDVPATVLFSGLAPTYVGLYQINAQVPATAPSGDTVPLLVSIGGATANTVTIAVQPGS